MKEKDFWQLAEVVAVNKNNKASVLQCLDQLRQGFVDRERLERAAKHHPEHERLVAKYLVFLEGLMLSRPKVAKKKVLTQRDWQRIDEYDSSTR